MARACIRCGYDLSGARGQPDAWVRCPECGEPDAGRPRGPRPGRLAAAQALIFPGAAIGLILASVRIGCDIGFASRSWWKAGGLAFLGTSAVSVAVVLLGWSAFRWAGQDPARAKAPATILAILAVALTLVSTALAALTAC